MFNYLFFNCCQGSSKDLEIDLNISTYSSPFSDEELMNSFIISLKTKLCLFTIYSKTRDLIPFNEIKYDDEIEPILTKKYFEKYEKPENNLSQKLIKKFSLQNVSLITMILCLNDNQNNILNSIDDIKLIDCLKDNDVTRHNVKKLIKIYQCLLYIPPPEPDINDKNNCNITFRFVDDKLSFSRRYDKNTKVEELFNIISSKYPKMSFRLFRISPSTELTELDNTLQQENLYPSGLIQVIS